MDGDKNPVTHALGRDAHTAAREHADRLAREHVDRLRIHDAGDEMKATDAAAPGPTIQRGEIAAIVHERRVKFSSDVNRVFRRAIELSDACTRALGEISREEAIEAIKREFNTQIERIR
jgi:hypothetical protein